ncbi:ASCH domain-containing protein [Furfurilactobacillus sp. WILCCON 0119]
MAYTAEQLWDEFIATHPTAAEMPHQAWSFGGGSEAADIEAMRVTAGLKQATTNLLAMYDHQHAPVPHNQAYEILYDGSVHAVAILQFVAVQVLPFNTITTEHAYFEGVGDRQLATWQADKTALFTAQATAIGTTFTATSPVVSLTFRVVYTPTLGINRH